MSKLRCQQARFLAVTPQRILIELYIKRKIQNNTFLRLFKFSKAFKVATSFYLNIHVSITRLRYQRAFLRATAESSDGTMNI